MEKKAATSGTRTEAAAEAVYITNCMMTDE